MAVVGEAHIIVRAITTGVKRDIQNGFNGVDGVASRAGKSIGGKFTQAFRRTQGNLFDKLNAGMQAVSDQAAAVRGAWVKLQKTGFALQSVIGVLAGSLGSLVGGLGSVVGMAGAVGASGIALVGVFVSLRLAAFAAGLALKGIGAAVSAAWKQTAKSDKASAASARRVEDARRNLARVIEGNAEQLVEANKRIEKAQRDLNQAFKDGQEEVQQLGFDAEDAAINEQKAALELERARETLLRVQDLPPNSRARREAELAFAEAELNYRRAVDTNKDLAAEQQSIAGDPKNTQGYIDAAEAVAEAEADKAKTVRDGLRQQEDAQRALEEALQDQKDALDGIGGGNDPFAGLTESQRKFAQFLVGLKPIFDGLKEDVAKGFLPELEKQIKRIIDSPALGIIKQGLTDIGIALGIATKNFVDEFLKPANLESLAQVFETSSYVTEKFGTIAGKAFGIILTALDAADPLIRRFVDFIESKLGIFDEFLKTENASGELTNFFNMAGELAANLGTVFGNIFGGIGALVADAVKPGSGAYMLIEWLQDATSGFANLGGDPGGLRTFLQDTAANSISIFQSIGSLFKEIMGLADMPEIKQFWDTLKEGAPFVGEILRNGILAAPSLANLVVEITKIIAAFADAGAPKAFFDTLAGAAKIVADILQNEVVKSILDFIGPITGVALAFGTIFSVIKNVGLLLIGIFGPGSPLVTAIGAIQGFFIRLIVSGSGILGILGRVGMFLTGPWGIAIGAAIAALTWFFTQTDIGKEMWANFTKFLGEAWDNVVKFFGDVATNFVSFFQGLWEGIKSFFQPVVDFFATAFKTAFDIMRGVFEVFKAVFLIAFVLIGTAVQAVWDGIKAGFKAVSDFLKPIVKGISDFFSPIFKGIGDFVGTIWKGMQAGFQAFSDWVKPIIKTVGDVFNTVFKGVGDFFKGIMNNMIGFAEGFVNFFIDGLNWIIGMINKIKLPIPELLRPIFGGASEIGFNIAKVQRLKLPRLAEGGVVRARPGGMLAQIAEGGRDERVEPLDSNGLSARDKAIIETLAARFSGGANGSIIINVQPAAGMDERLLATQISKQLALQLRKGAIA